MPSARAVRRTTLNVVAVVVGVAIGLYLLFLLKKPIGWILIALFLAVALSGPVNRLERSMKRGFAIAVVYIGLLLIPIGIGAVIVPPMVTQLDNLVQKAPDYAQDLQDFVAKNHRLRKLNEDYKVTDKLKEEAGKLPNKLGGAAGTLTDIGFGLVNSIFALITILVLTAFMLGSGRIWVARAVQFAPEDRRERIDRVLRRSASAVGNYVGGALLQATIAGVTSFLVLTLLGVPFRAPLAVVVFFADLIPLIGATIGAVLVGIVTLFTDFPTATIVWSIFSVIYQQVENTVIQPQIQKRAVNVHPFVVMVAVLCGATLLGVTGALVAIPIAATVQITLYEWWAWRAESRAAALT